MLKKYDKKKKKFAEKYPTKRGGGTDTEFVLPQLT